MFWFLSEVFGWLEGPMIYFQEFGGILTIYLGRQRQQDCWWTVHGSTHQHMLARLFLRHGLQRTLAVFRENVDTH